jgi:glucosamine 6-phosphate synthetase-like amidotransferase/phosphosugar isomerase protein
MSGLSGLILGTKERTGEDYQRLAGLFGRLFAASDERGTDAAGVATVSRSGHHSLFKRNARAGVLLSAPDYQDRLLSILRKVGPRTTVVLGHARRGTVPTPYAGRNNQPIRAGHVIGTHDGRILNAEDLFARWGLRRFSESSSEVLFRMADELVEDGAFQVDRLRQRLREVRGSLAAVMTSRVAAGEVLMLKGNRPIELAFHPEDHAILWASERRFLDAVLGDEAGWEPVDLAANTLARFRVRDLSDFEVEPMEWGAEEVDEATEGEGGVPVEAEAEGQEAVFAGAGGPEPFGGGSLPYLDDDDDDDE